MANSREALSQWNVIKVVSAGGWECVSWLELPHYRLTKREEKREEAEGDYGLTPVSEVGSGRQALQSREAAPDECLEDLVRFISTDSATTRSKACRIRG